MDLSFQHIRQSFGDLEVIADFTGHVKAGELLALLGPSGCGKSTLLHIAAGLEDASGGQVLADGVPIRNPEPSRTLMFQENALFPWLTLQRNVATALELRKVSRRQAQERAAAWLKKVDLAGFDDYYPHQVSGGMRQRCALARAFIGQPGVLLLDEPFGALDALTRLNLQDVLLDLIRETRPTVLLVTHDVDEALYLADRTLVLSARPARVLHAFERPQTPAQRARARRDILGLLGVAGGRKESSIPLQSKEFVA